MSSWLVCTLVREELAECEPGGGGLEVGGLVAPLLHHRLGHLPGVRLHVDADLLGDLDAVWLLDQPGTG